MTMPEEVADLLRAGNAVVLHRAIEEVGLDPDLLSPEEKNRLETFTHITSQRTFFAGRILIRQVLGSLLEEVTLRVGTHGKPVCIHPDAPAFNLSHAEQTVAVLFSPLGPVGADIEPVHRTPKNPDALAKKVFTEKERIELSAGHRDFLSLWTRKEAVLKAMGSGFTAGAGGVQTEEVASESGWRLEEFRDERIRGAVCVPETVPLIFR